jgi:hypothetical protein
MLKTIASRLFALLYARVAAARSPDFVIGEDNPDGAYLLRWYLTPWRSWYRDVPEDKRTTWARFAIRLSRWLPNLYLHCFLRDDDDRALHDHPSWAVSFILDTGYIEHTIAEGGVHRRLRYWAGDIRFLPTRHTHRIELLRDGGRSRPCWTLFLFGPTVREWGFHCPKGWVPWQEFTAAGKPGEVGRGCD